MSNYSHHFSIRLVLCKKKPTTTVTWSGRFDYYTEKYIIEKFDVDWSQMVLIICYTLV
jgi:hypothetical protein